MTDQTPFEARLIEALDRYADRARIDDVAIVVRVATEERRAVAGRLFDFLRGSRRLPLLLLVILLLAVVASTLAVGALLRRDPALVVVPSLHTGPIEAGKLLGTREGGAAALLADGRVLVVGGGVPPEVWEPSTQRFVATGQSFVEGLTVEAVRLRDGRVLVVGESQAAKLFDPASGTFSVTGSMHQARGTCHCGVAFLTLVHASAVLLDDGRVFVSGGQTSAPPETYDPASGTFSQTAAMPCDAARGAGAKLRDGRVLVLCLDGEGSGKAVLYDPEANAYVGIGPPTTSNVGAATVLQDGRVLITGHGRRGSNDPAEMFDPSTATFRRLATTTNPAQGQSARLDDGRILFAGDGTGPPMLFDPTSETFASITSLAPSTVDGIAVPLRDGMVLVVGSTSAKLLDARDLP